jgi:hypothetical protein
MQEVRAGGVVGQENDAKTGTQAGRHQEADGGADDHTPARDEKGNAKEAGRACRGHGEEEDRRACGRRTPSS